jgi:hypothetical protein
MTNSKNKMFIKREVVKLRKKIRILKEEQKIFYELAFRFTNKISKVKNDISVYQNRINTLINEDEYNFA